MGECLRWGIVGTGNIANQFAAGVAGAVRSEVVAVGSRTAAAAEAFARKHAVPAAHGSYDALLADASVEAVYLSLPNAMHHAWTLKALAAGKHVLCEKPISTNAAEAEVMFDAAQRAGRVLIEAFMYRCHPLTAAYTRAIAEGLIGTVRHIRSSFCYRAATIDGNVRYSAELAGGALMDIGCYCLSFSRMIAGGEPVSACVTGHLHETGVDEFATGTLTFAHGVTASFTCGMNLQANNAVHVSGDGGWIEVPVPWKPPVQQAVWVRDGQIPPKLDGGGVKPGRQVHHVDAGAPLYALEADAFAAVVAGEAAPFVSASDSIGNMRLLDALRGQLGLSF